MSQTAVEDYDNDDLPDAEELEEEELEEEDLEGYEELDAPLAIRVAAEAAGSFILVFIGLGALLYSEVLRADDPLINALAFGVAMAAAMALFTGISGGHVNPAISLGAAIKGTLRWVDLPAYWIGQLIGAVGAAALLFVTLPSGLAAQLQSTERAFFGQTATTYGDQSSLAQLTQGELTFSLGQVIALEAVATGIFVAVCLGASSWVRNAVVPVVAGLTLTGVLLVLGPVSGGSVNPARSTASAVFSDPAVLGQLWVFWAAPLVGGAVAGLSYALFAPRPISEIEDWQEDDDDWSDVEEDLSADAEQAEAEDAETADAEHGDHAAALPATTLEFDPDAQEPVATLEDDDAPDEAVGEDTVGDGAKSDDSEDDDAANRP